MNWFRGRSKNTFEKDKYKKILFLQAFFAIIVIVVETSFLFLSHFLLFFMISVLSWKKKKSFPQHLNAIRLDVGQLISSSVLTVEEKLNLSKRTKRNSCFSHIIWWFAQILKYPWGYSVIINAQIIQKLQMVLTN